MLGVVARIAQATKADITTFLINSAEAIGGYEELLGTAKGFIRKDWHPASLPYAFQLIGVCVARITRRLL